jgi:hypothetical protein
VPDGETYLEGSCDCAGGMPGLKAVGVFDLLLTQSDCS